MTFTKDLLARHSKKFRKGRLEAVEMLNKLARAAGLPDPTYAYEPGGTHKRPSHFMKVSSPGDDGRLSGRPAGPRPAAPRPRALRITDTTLAPSWWASGDRLASLTRRSRERLGARWNRFSPPRQLSSEALDPREQAKGGDNGPTAALEAWWCPW